MKVVSPAEQELENGQNDLQPPVYIEAAELLGIAVEELAGWQINRIREDGAIDAYVPLAEIQVKGVPTNPRNTDRLVGLFNDRAAENGGTGQRDPVVIGHVPGEGFYMLDGFHRHETQSLRGETHLHATIEPNLTYEQVVERRLEYAHTHPEIEFARQVEWMQSVWERTAWHGTVPNVLTAFRAFQDDYGYEKSDDVELLDSLSDEMYKQIRKWVVEKSKEWGYTPAQIRENLAKVESFDRDLMPLVYQKQGVPPTGRITLKHVETITDAFAGEFDIQRAVVDIIVDQELTTVQTEALIRQLEDDNPRDAEAVYASTKVIDFLQLKASVIKDRKVIHRFNQKNRASHEAVDLDSYTVMEAMSKFLPDIKKRVADGEWDSADTQNALEITLVLSEILAQLTLRSAGVTVGQVDGNA